jgi:hypothetical protein
VSGWYWLALAVGYALVVVLGLAIARSARRHERDAQDDESLARLKRARRAEERDGWAEFEWPPTRGPR